MYNEIEFGRIKPLLIKYRITTLPYVDFNEIESYYNNNIEAINQRFNDSDKIYFPSEFKIGKYTGMFNTQIFSSIGAYSYTWSSLQDFVTVGNYSSIAYGLNFTGDEHPLDTVSTSAVLYNKYLFYSNMDLTEHNIKFTHIEKQDFKNDGNVYIGNDVWIGENVTIKRGIDIPDGCVIGTHALVTKTPEPYSVIGGVPAKLIKKRFSDDLIQELIDSKWWDYPFYKICNLCMDNPREFLKKLKDVEPSCKSELQYLTNVELDEFLSK